LGLDAELSEFSVMLVPCLIKFLPTEVTYITTNTRCKTTLSTV